MRLWAGWLSGVIVRTPVFQEEAFPRGGEDEIKFLKGVEDAGWNRMDARDWIYQSWAYDQHNVGYTRGFDGDVAKALGSIKAKTLILAGSTDLLNPEYESSEAAKHIPGARFVSINARRPMGHLSGAGATAPENEVQNREIRAFLEEVTAARR
jgi:homoserine O-acetyltransferase